VNDLANKQAYALGLEYATVGGRHEANPQNQDGSQEYYVNLYDQLLGITSTPKPPSQQQARLTVVGTGRATQPKPPQYDVPENATEGLAEPVRPDQSDAYGEQSVQIAQDAHQQETMTVQNQDQPMEWESIVGADPDQTGDKGDDLAGTLADELMANPLKQATLINKVLGTKPPLEAGAERRGPTGNFHFFSLKYSPWPPDDVYHKPVHGFVTDELMQPEQIVEYEKAYGSLSNTLLRGNQPHTLKYVAGTHGTERRINGKRVLDMRLDSYTLTDLSDEDREMFRRNMRRILSIYHDTSGALGLTQKIGVKEKQKGMENGIFIPKGSAAVKCPEVQYTRAGNKELLPPVFKNKPPKDATFTRSDGTLWRGAKLEPRDSAWRAYTNAPVNNIVSGMTVLEWLQTPWHYEYLPYQPMNSVFKDGETYCNGCTRCSRPFYDYEFLYASYHLTERFTRHWVNQYWRRGSKAEWDCTHAPEPFHEKDFWSAGEVYAYKRKDAQNIGTALEDRETTEFDGKGYHKWPTHLFLLGYDSELVTDTVVGRAQQLGQWKAEGKNEKYSFTASKPSKGDLSEEWTKRYQQADFRGLLGGLLGQQPMSLFNLHRTEQPWTFRKYISHTYDPDHKKMVRKESRAHMANRALEEKNGCDTLVQGVVRTTNARICYGMCEYKLMRSIKYGNVCRDCMATLDYAHLYKRSGRVTSTAQMFSGKQLAGRSNDFDTWWLQLENAKMADGTRFDPWFIYLSTPAYHKPKKKDIKEGRPTQGANRANTYKALVQNGSILGNKDDDSKRQTILTMLYQKGKRAAYMKIFPIQEGESKEAYEARLDQRIDVHLDHVAQHTKETACLVQKDSVPITKVIKPPDVYTQKYWDEYPIDDRTKRWKERDLKAMEFATDFLDKIVNWLDETYKPHDNATSPHPITPATRDLVLRADETTMQNRYNRALRDALHDTHSLMSHMSAFKREETAPQFDPNLERLEKRNETIGEEEHCLVIEQPVTPTVVARRAELQQQGDEVVNVPQYERREGTMLVRTFKPSNSDWDGDEYVTKHQGPARQVRKLTQSRMFITYSLHRRVFSELEARSVLEKMADAVRTLFGNDKELCKLVVFGMKVQGAGTEKDSVSSKEMLPIRNANKKDKLFYGHDGHNSYVYDTYLSHVESVTVDAGIEIGPTYHHPHFHALVTINHFSYVQIDTFRMKSILEQMFKGTHRDHKQQFMLIDGAGLPFYTDNENPYIDIRMYPSDNWAEVVAAYVRKGADKESIMSLRARTGDIRVAGAQSISGGT